MQDSIKNEMSKLRRLVSFKNAEEATIEKAARKNVTLRDLVGSGNFLDNKEKELATKIYEAYLSQHDFDSFSDLTTLSTLVYSEVLLTRIQKAINACTDKDGKSYISDKLLGSHEDLVNQILSLKKKLGIDREEKIDEMSALQLLKKRFHSFIQDNKNEFMLYVPFECPKCNHSDVKPVLLRRRVKDFEVLENPHFSGRFWYNKSAMDMVKEGTLSKAAYAKIFSTSCDYVQWVLDNEGKIILNQVEKK